MSEEVWIGDVKLRKPKQFDVIKSEDKNNVIEAFKRIKDKYLSYFGLFIKRTDIPSMINSMRKVSTGDYVLITDLNESLDTIQAFIEELDARGIQNDPFALLKKKIKIIPYATYGSVVYSWVQRKLVECLKHLYDAIEQALPSFTKYIKIKLGIETEEYQYTLTPIWGQFKYDKYNRGYNPNPNHSLTVYVGSADTYLYALSPNGTLKFRYKTGGEIIGGIAIDDDGNIYVTSRDGYLYVLDNNGNLLYKFYAGDELLCHPTVEGDYTTYIINKSCWIYAVRNDGSLKFSLRLDPHYATGTYYQCTCTIGYDGCIYVSVFGLTWVVHPLGYIRGILVSVGCENNAVKFLSDNSIIVCDWFLQNLIIYNKDLSLRWNVNLPLPKTSAVDDNNNIYVSCASSTLSGFYGSVCKVIPYSGVAWEYGTYDYVVGAVAIGYGDAIYFGSLDYYVYSLTKSGSLRWKYQTNNEVWPSPSLDQDENVYIGSCDTYFYKFDKDGNLLWRYKTGDMVRCPASLAGKP